MKKTVLLTAIAILGAAVPASALVAEQKVYKEVVKPSEDGPPVMSRVPADLVAPGDTVIYALAYTNDKAEAVSNIVLTMPVPDEVTYIEASANADGADVLYSADGENFAARDAVMVDEGGVARPARGEEISHIRWRVTKTIAPGTSGELAFKGRLK